jgi:hypothetical protein
VSDRQQKNIDYVANEQGGVYVDNIASTQVLRCQLAVLMDIRRELQTVKHRLGVLECTDFLAIPRKLDRIARNTTRKKRRAAKYP